MSSEALYWLNTQGGHLEVPSSQAIGEARVWRVLANLTAHTNEQTGQVWVSDRTQEKETGIPRRLIRKARELLIEAGLLTDTGTTRTKGVKVYLLTLPGYSWAGVDNASSGQGSGQASGQGSGQDSLPQTEQNLNTPLPPTNRPKREQDKTPRGGGKEWGERHEQVLALVLAREDMSRDRGGLRQHLTALYRPLVINALRDYPGRNNDTLAQMARKARAGDTDPVPTPTTNTDCETCKGRPWVADPETGDLVRCPVCHPSATQEDTHKRVTPDRAPNTDPPAPGATADPGSDPVSDLAKRLRRVV